MVPKKLHFITGLKEDFGGKPFLFAHYMAVRSALSVNPGFKAYVYFQYEPSGPYWDLIKDEVECVRVEAPTEIFGNKLDHFAHKADVLRLQILIREGGVYMDFDTICQKPFEPLFGDRVVMGIESHTMGMDGYNRGEPVGLCNALIIAPANAQFLQNWYEEYHNFDQSQWNHHSVILPSRLARQYPDLIQVEPAERFFWPTCGIENIKDIFVNAYDFPESVSIHLWESFSWPQLSALNCKSVLSDDTTYSRIARRFISSDREALTRAHDMTYTPQDEVVRQRFDLIYRNGAWGQGSGPGSSPENTLDYRHFLAKFMSQNNIRSVADFGCGDWQFSRFIDWSGVFYTGIDIVEDVIIQNRARFQTANINFLNFSGIDDFPNVDLVICKDVLQHLSNDRVKQYIEAWRRRSKYMLITNDINPPDALNSEIPDSGWRPIRLDLPPFSLQSVVLFEWDVHHGSGSHRKATYLVFGSA